MGRLRLRRTPDPRARNCWVRSVAAIALAMGAVPGVRAQDEPVQLFVLAGQSNMEGKGFPEPMAYQIGRADYRDRYTDYIVDGDHAGFVRRLEGSADPDRPDYAWREREDVWVEFLGRRGPLRVGFGVPAKAFGPELGFGTVVGDATAVPVLLVKTAWGGKSLGRDFLPPSAAQPTAEALEALAAQRNAAIDEDNARRRAQHEARDEPRAFAPRPHVTAAELRAAYGHYYREMVREVKAAVAELDDRFPQLAGRPVEVAGLVWFQGWNDQFDGEWSANYGANLGHLIRDLRRDLGVPSLPVVIGQIGFDGPRPDPAGKDGAAGPRTLIKQGQAAVAALPEFAGTVAVVPTAGFWDMEADAIYRGPGGWSADVARWRQHGNDRPYHYLGSPWFFSRAGRAMGHAMLELRH